jgi:hypothetical protein
MKMKLTAGTLIARLQKVAKKMNATNFQAISNYIMDRDFENADKLLKVWGA